MKFLATWLVLAALWIGMSGHFDAVHLVFGFVSVTLVSILSWRDMTGEGPFGRGLGMVLRLFAYAPWLLWQIALANWDVLLRVLGIREVSPRLVRFKPDLHSEFGEVTFANSITLTPGTVTIEVDDGHFVVHAIAPAAAEGLLNGEMERRVRWVEGPRP